MNASSIIICSIRINHLLCLWRSPTKTVLFIICFHVFKFNWYLFLESRDLKSIVLVIRWAHTSKIVVEYIIEIITYYWLKHSLFDEKSFIVKITVQVHFKVCSFVIFSKLLSMCVVLRGKIWLRFLNMSLFIILSILIHDQMIQYLLSYILFSFNFLIEIQ